MVTIVGLIVVVAAVLGGFTMAGGHIGALIHPSEIVTIGGAALGAMIVMAPASVLKNLVKGLLGTVKGNPFGKAAYEELFRLLYQLFRKARRDGLLALEAHISNPHDSAVFQRYPKISNNHHVTEFIRGAFGPILDGSVTPDQLSMLLETEIKAAEDEHHAPSSVLSKTADALPGFGIVAAVLGIVITMGHISGPPEEIGHKVGAALVGTFLGILASYGFIAPLVVKLEFQGISESCFLRTIASAINAFVSNMPPKVAIEAARRGLPSDVRPSAEDLEGMLKEVDSLSD
jgi:chemotaxis protein MotA